MDGSGYSVIHSTLKYISLNRNNGGIMCSNLRTKKQSLTICTTKIV